MTGNTGVNKHKAPNGETIKMGHFRWLSHLQLKYDNEVSPPLTKGTLTQIQNISDLSSFSKSKMALGFMNKILILCFSNKS